MATPASSTVPAPAAEPAGPTGAFPASDDRASWPTGRLLSMSGRLVEGAWTERLAAQGLTHAGLMALHGLSDGDAVPTFELAARCQVTPQTMTRTVDRLERDLLVDRHRDESDRRRVAVTLTPRGYEAYRQAADMSEAEPALLGHVVDLPALRKSLVAIIENLTDGTARTLP